MAEQPTTRKLMNHVVEEVFAVMRAAGYATHWPTPEQFLATFYGRLVPDTAGHESSMLQDMAVGKRTEIDALTGAVISLAAQHGIDVPHNHTVYQLIRFMENRRSSNLRI